MRWLVALLIALAASPAGAQYVNRVVPAGGSLKGMSLYSINPDCSLAEYPTVRITAEPASGVVLVTKGKAFPNFPPSNPRSACNARRVPAVLLEYRPRRDFVGSDRFTVDVFFPAGREENFTVNLTVK